jgi:SnoaL-like protein
MITDEMAIHRLIARFANSFDLKAWGELEACLAETLHTDYSDLRGTPPESMSRGRFVELRRLALQELRTHHLAGNVEVEVDGSDATARVSMVIYRRRADGDVLNTHCLYTLGLKKEKAAWWIGSIVQKVLWSDGNKAIHGGIAKA